MKASSFNALLTGASSVFFIANALPAPQAVSTLTKTTYLTRTVSLSEPTGKPIDHDGNPRHDSSQNTWMQGHINPSGRFLRGVNLGGWLILEKWMAPNVFSGTDAVDQYTFDQTANAEERLQQHWSTFFTETDIRKLKSYGVNALRIPIGFWAYNNSDTPYIQGAAEYLETAIGWAREYDMHVWVDLHGLPGSQNGFDNSGQQGEVNWQKGDNMNRSTSILTYMASKYGCMAYADVVAGIEMANEPISWGNNNFNVTKAWAIRTYNAMRAVAENKQLQIVMHDSFVDASNWFDAAKQLNGASNDTLRDSIPHVNGTSTATDKFYGFALDTHLYQIFNDADNMLNQDAHIARACASRNTALLPAQKNSLPIYVGEWTATTNVCINPDGSSISGTSTTNDCKVPGCQCAVDTPTNEWSNATKSAVKKFVSAQLSSYEAASSGYFVWSAKAPGTWSFMQGVEEGWFPRLDEDFQHTCDGVDG